MEKRDDSQKGAVNASILTANPRVNRLNGVNISDPSPEPEDVRLFFLGVDQSDPREAVLLLIAARSYQIKNPPSVDRNTVEIELEASSTSSSGLLFISVDMEEEVARSNWSFEVSLNVPKAFAAEDEELKGKFKYRVRKS